MVYLQIGRWLFLVAAISALAGLSPGSVEAFSGVGRPVSDSPLTTLVRPTRAQVVTAGVVRDAKGGFHVAGNTGPRGVNIFGGRLWLAHFDRRSRLVRGFGRRGLTAVSLPQGPATAMAVAKQTDGRHVVVGAVGRGDIAARLLVVRFTRDGRLDRSFDEDGILTADPGTAANATATAVAIQPNGAIVVAGTLGGRFPRDGLNSGLVVWRLLPDGSPDPGFGVSGLVRIPSASDLYYLDAEAVTVLPSGAILVGGNAGAVGRKGNSMVVVRLAPDGSLDPAVGQEGILYYRDAMDHTLRDLIFDRATGRVYVAGDGADLDGGLSHFFVCALSSADLSVDRGFGNRGFGAASFSRAGAVATAIAVDGRQRLVLAGAALRDDTAAPVSDGSASFALARFKSTGRLDRRFGRNGRLRIRFGSNWASARDLALGPGRRILVAGTGGKAPAKGRLLYSTGRHIALGRLR